MGKFGTYPSNNGDPQCDDPEAETAYDEQAEERARMREERIEREAEEHNQGV